MLPLGSVMPGAYEKPDLIYVPPPVGATKEWSSDPSYSVGDLKNRVLVEGTRHSPPRIVIPLVEEATPRQKAD